MTEANIDPYRLTAAAHELGHALTWHVLGFQVDRICVKGRGDSARGQVTIDIPKNKPRTVELERGIHIGLLAGREAQLRWCDETGLPFDERGCADDMAQHRRRRSAELNRELKTSALQAEARTLLRSHWRRLARLTPVLAAQGSLSPSRL